MHVRRWASRFKSGSDPTASGESSNTGSSGKTGAGEGGVGGVGGVSECQSSTSSRRALPSSQTPQQMFYISSCGR